MVDRGWLGGAGEFTSETQWSTDPLGQNGTLTSPPSGSEAGYFDLGGTVDFSSDVSNGLDYINTLTEFELDGNDYLLAGVAPSSGDPYSGVPGLWFNSGDKPNTGYAGELDVLGPGTLGITGGGIAGNGFTLLIANGAAVDDSGQSAFAGGVNIDIGQSSTLELRSTTYPNTVIGGLPGKDQIT